MISAGSGIRSGSSVQGHTAAKKISWPLQLRSDFKTLSLHFCAKVLLSKSIFFFWLAKKLECTGWSWDSCEWYPRTYGFAKDVGSQQEEKITATDRRKYSRISQPWQFWKHFLCGWWIKKGKNSEIIGFFKGALLANFTELHFLKNVPGDQAEQGKSRRPRKSWEEDAQRAIDGAPGQRS